MRRPAASRRAVRRRYAILGVLGGIGPASAPMIAAKLARNAGAIYVDLVWMEDRELIVSEWEDDHLARVTQTMPPKPPPVGAPRRRIYRLPDGTS